MVAVLAATACAKKDPILPGEREGIREVLQTEARRAQAVETPANRVAPVALPAAVANPEWRQRPGTPIGRIGGGAHSGGWYTHTHLQVITARAEAEGRGMQGYVTAEDLCRIEDLFPTPYPLFVT